MQSIAFRVSSSLLKSSRTIKAPLLRSRFHLSAINMSVKVGDTLPDALLHEHTPQTKVQLSEAIKDKKVLIFAVPGAFTPGCSVTHLPGYLEREKELKSKGIDEIFCVAVNDAFVMDAWCEKNEAAGKIRFLADPQLEFTRKLGLETDIPVLGGARSKRYAMVVDHGKVTQLNVEPDGTGLTCSLAEHIKI